MGFGKLKSFNSVSLVYVLNYHNLGSYFCTAIHIILYIPYVENFVCIPNFLYSYFSYYLLLLENQKVKVVN